MKKVLSIVLALTLVLGSFSMAFASNSTGSAVTSGVNNVRLTDIAGNAHEEAIQVAYDLGIVTGNPNGTFEPEKAVTRAEFAAMIVRALAIPDSALAGYTTTRFNDTSGYGWAVPYLAFCQEKGIMLGDGYGNAMPGRTITANEAVTMTLRAIGYTNNAATLVGTWPANYVSLGQSLGLYKDVATDAQINKSNAAQMIYNGLTVPLVQVGTNGQVTTITQLVDGRQQAVNMLTAGLDCYEWPARRAINNGWAIQYTVFTAENTDNSKINMTPYIGAYGMVYKSNKDDAIVAIGELKSQFVTGEFTFTGTKGLTADFNKFEIDDVEYTLANNAKDVLKGIRDGNDPNGLDIGNFEDQSVSGNYYETLMNGETQDFNEPDVVAAMGINANNDTKLMTLAVDLNGRTINMIHSVSYWNVEGTGSDHFRFESGMLSAKQFDGHDFPLTDTDAIDYNAFELLGVNSLDDIKVGNVVYIYENKDTEEISRIAVGTETVSGKITRSSDGDFTIGGKVYNLAEPNEDGLDDDSLKVNDEGTAYLDAYGKIYYFDKDAGSAGNYAVFIQEGSSSFDNQVKLYMQDDEEKIYTVHNDYKGVNDNNDADSFPNPDTLAKYTLSGGKVKTLYNKYTNPAGKVEVDNGDSEGGRFNKAGTVFTPINGNDKGNGISIDSNVVIYAKDRSDDYKVTKLSDVKKDSDLKNKDGIRFQWLTDRNGKIVAMIIPTDGSGAEDVYAMINKVALVASGDEDVNELEGIDSKRSSKTWKYTDDNFLDDIGGSDTPVPYLVQFSIDGDGTLRNADIVAGANIVANDAVINDYKSGSIEITAGSNGDLGWVGIESGTAVFVPNSKNDAWEVRTPSRALLTDTDREWTVIKTDVDEAVDVIVQSNNINF